MNEDGGALVGAMVEESDDSRIIKIPVADVIADLNAEMSSTHAACEFDAGRVNILQRHLAERAQSSFATSAEIERCVIKYASALQSMLRFAIVGKEHGRGGNDLLSYTIAIHLFEAHVCVPTSRGDLTKHAIPDHDRGFARLGVLDRRPIGRAEARLKVRPRFGEEMCMNVCDWHVVFCLLASRYFFAGFPG
jgi:hypothetical protein